MKPTTDEVKLKQMILRGANRIKLNPVLGGGKIGNEKYDAPSELIDLLVQERFEGIIIEREKTVSHQDFVWHSSYQEWKVVKNNAEKNGFECLSIDLPPLAIKAWSVGEKGAVGRTQRGIVHALPIELYDGIFKDRECNFADEKERTQFVNGE